MPCSYHGSAADCYCDKAPDPPPRGCIACILGALGVVAVIVWVLVRR